MEKYWNSKITEWELSAYEGKARKSIIEKMANKFRNPIRKRSEIAFEFLNGIVKEKIVLELGCGTGIFCYRLAEVCQPKKIIGIDISSVAIEKAIEKNKRRTVDGGIEMVFEKGDVGKMERLPKADVVVGLGFIDYLDRYQLKELFNKIESEYFFFSFPEKKFSLMNILHYFYLKSQGCPSFNKFRRKEMIEIIPSHYKYYFLEKDGMVFITNIKSKIKNLKNEQ